MDSLLLRIITLSMALIALPFIDDGLGVDALNAQQSQATALGRRSAGQRIAAAVASLTPFAVVARPEGVNKPELLPTTLVDGRRPNVIDVKVDADVDATDAAEGILLNYVGHLAALEKEVSAAAR